MTATTTTRVAKRKVTKAPAKKATPSTGRVATRPKPQPVEPTKVEMPKGRVAKKVAAKVNKPKAEPILFAFLLDGEVKQTKEFATVEEAKTFAEREMVEAPKRGWTFKWTGNRGGYQMTRLNSNGKAIDSPVTIKRANPDGSVPMPKAKTEPLGFDEHGYRNGSDSSIAAHILMEGGESRADINERVAEAIAEANGGNLTTRGGKPKVIPTIVGNVVMRLTKEKGYKVESTWRLVPPTK